MSKLKNLLLLLTLTFITTTVIAQEGKIQKSPTYQPKSSMEPVKKPVKVEKANPADANKIMPVKPGTSKVAGDELPSDFPKFVDTGNPDLDAANYSNAKTKWYAENPKRAAEINGKNTTTIQEVTKARFNSLTEEQKQHILNNPDRYKIID